MKHIKTLLLIILILLMLASCTEKNNASTTFLTTTKDDITTTISNNDTSSTKKEITTIDNVSTTTTTKEHITTQEITTTTQEPITTTHENVTTEHVHSYSSDWIVVEPTDIKNGYRYKKCDDCDDIYIDPDYVIDSLSYIDGLKFELSEDESYYIVSGKDDYSYDIVVIPSTYNNLPIKEIKERAFYNFENILSVYISNSVISIGNNAFYNCSSLTSITIPDSVTSIGNNAFYGCSSLKKVNISSVSSWCNIDFYNSNSNPLSKATNLYLNDKLVTSLIIPDTVFEIKPYTFYNYLSLSSVTIPESITSIGINAFLNCYKLVEVVNKSDLELTIGSSNYGSIAYYAKSILKNKEESKLSIIDDVFVTCADGDNIILTNYLGDSKSVIVLDNITSIGDYAFYNCSSLTSITIPDSVTSIGNNAFYGCSSLKKVNISSVSSWCNIDFYNPNSNPLSRATNLYLNDKLVTSLIIPDTVIEIKPHTFYNCLSLLSVTIPESITSIGINAFLNCYKLVEVVNKSNLELTIGSRDNGHIAYNAIEIIDDASKSKLSETEDGFVLHTDDDSITLINYSSNHENIIIPEQVTSIGKYAFYGCKFIKSINIPNSVTSIGDYAFYGCNSLNRVNINSIESWCNISFEYNYSNPVFYAKNLYINDELLTDLVIPDSITSIGKNTFYYCEGIESVILHSTFTNFDITCFDRTYLRTIFVDEDNENYISIDGSLYSKDGKCLIFASKNVDGNYAVLYGVEEIGAYAFSSNTYLKTVSLPSTIQKIGIDAFLHCSSLNRVNIDDLKSWCKIVFEPTYGYGDYYPSYSNPLMYAHNLYLNGELVVNLVIPESIVSLKLMTFAGCTSIRSVTIPEGFSSFQIANYGSSVTVLTFYDCTNLQLVNNYSKEIYITKGSKAHGMVGYYAIEVYNNYFEN